MRDTNETARGLGKDGEPCLLFFLRGEAYGIRIRMLREIVSPLGMKPLPSTDFKYCQEFDFRGNKVPVMRLSDFFGYPGSPDDPKSVLVIEGERVFGLLVDSIKGIWNIRDAELKPFPQLATSLSPQYIRGIAKVEGKIVYFLNEDRFSRSSEVSSFYRS